MKEMIVYGFNAVNAALERRPDSVIRLFFTDEMAPRFGKICSEMARARKIYRSVSEDELEKICRSSHHGGVVGVFEGRMSLEPGASEVAEWNENKERILVFDRVSNTHNMGAMVRTAAFLGIRHILVDRKTAATMQTPSSSRVAEGGLEVVSIWEVPSVADFLTTFKSRLMVVGTDQRARTDLDSLRAKPSVWAGALCIVMGNEEEGMSPEMRALCDELISIPGSGAIESLNVVQAAAICMYVLAGKPKVLEPVRKPKPAAAAGSGSPAGSERNRTRVAKARPKVAIPRDATAVLKETQPDGSTITKKVYRLRKKG